MPHNVQKDPESSHTWILKDEVVRRSKVYYGKLARGKTMFIALRFGAQPFFLFTLCDAPDRVEMRDHSQRDEHGYAARQLAVIRLAAPDNLVLQYPRVRTFRVFLNVVRHHGVAPPADGDV